MTKPREKTREELTAEIEESKKKIRQFENREKIIKQKLSVEERKARNHRLCKRGGFMESLVPELIAPYFLTPNLQFPFPENSTPKCPPNPRRLRPWL